MGNCLATDSSSRRNYVSSHLTSLFRSNIEANSLHNHHVNANQRASNHIVSPQPDLLAGDIPFRSSSNHLNSSAHVIQTPNNNSNGISRVNNSKNKSFLGIGGNQMNISNNISNCDVANNNNDHQIMICLTDFNTKLESELSVKKGDRLKVFDINEPDWWLAEHLTTKKSGFIPKNYVASQAIEMEEWFFSKISRREAEKLLLTDNLGRGTFIVRNSEGHTGYSLSIRDRDQNSPVKHYKIRTLDNGGYFISPRNTFKSVSELVAFYSTGTNGLCCRLLKPCPKPKPSFWPDRSNEIQRSELQFLHEIGSGYFGKVYYGMYRNVAVAVKTLKQGTMSPQAFLEEAIIMRKCRHPKLVPLYGVCSQGEPLLIITEFMCNGSLLDYLRNNRESKNLNLPDLIDIAAQIADGMSYLEKMKLVHRDLAARNILVGENNTVKVADFGLARVLEDTYVAKHGSKFPVKWCALESALYGRFSEKSDVWSFGVVLFELVTYGQIPYAGMQNKEVVDQIQKGYRMPKPTNCDCPDAVYAKMLECWQADPEKRPTFEYLATFFENFNISSEQSYRDAVDCF